MCGPPLDGDEAVEISHILVDVCHRPLTDVPEPLRLAGKAAGSLAQQGLQDPQLEGQGVGHILADVGVHRLPCPDCVLLPPAHHFATLNASSEKAEHAPPSIFEALQRA